MQNQPCQEQISLEVTLALASLLLSLKGNPDSLEKCLQKFQPLKKPDQQIEK